MIINKHAYMIMFEVNETKGGITSAMMSRSKLFQENGIKADLITFNYDLEYESMTNRLIELGKLDRKTKIMNLHNYYREKFTVSQGVKYEKPTSKFFSIVGNDKHHFDNGVLTCIEHYNDHEELFELSFYDEIGSLKEAVELRKGFIHRKSTFKDGIIVYERLLTIDGFCYLTRKFDSKTQKIHEVLLFDRHENIVKRFENDAKLASHWMSELCERDEDSILIVDGQGSLSRALEVDNAKKYYIIHQNHLQNPYTIGSPIGKVYEGVFKNAKKLDGLIVLTEKQKRDVELQFQLNNLHVIPNYSQIHEFEAWEKDQFKVTMVSRLAKTKRIDKTIDLFSIVAESEPKARLEIFGDGPEKKNLMDIVKKKNLNKNVIFKGHTKNVQKEMSESIATVLTSDAEGFGLVIAESLLSETPVVALDCNYGPSDIITNGSDGYVADDIQSMADKLIQLINDPEKSTEMGKIGRKNIKLKYSKEAILSSWINLFESAN